MRAKGVHIRVTTVAPLPVVVVVEFSLFIGGVFKIACNLGCFCAEEQVWDNQFEMYH